jgi:hypothetical protein
MRTWPKIVLLFILLTYAFLPAAYSEVAQDEPWIEVCKAKSQRYFLNSKYITEDPASYKGNNGLLVNTWIRVAPRTDTKEGIEAHGRHLKDLKKKAKKTYQSFAYQLVKTSYRCDHRRYNVYEAWDYDAEGNILHKWKQDGPGLAVVLYGETVAPESTNECLMELACGVIKERNTPLLVPPSLESLPRKKP